MRQKLLHCGISVTLCPVRVDPVEKGLVDIDES
jgi:hypothetical protein